MAITEQKRMTSVANVMNRLRENAGLTTRQAAGIISVTHITISNFETGRRDFPSLRIGQLVKGYGYTMEEFEKILGHRSVISHKDDCVTISANWTTINFLQFARSYPRCYAILERQLQQMSQ